MKIAVIPGFWLMALLCGCRSLPLLPPVNLRSPGWTVHRGQAVWTEAKGKAGVAGELLLATRADGACYVEFAKPPFTLATAQAEAEAWSIERPSARQHSGGRGPGPTQFVWFALASKMCGRPAGGGWHFESDSTPAWRLTNARTGELLEGYFAA